MLPATVHGLSREALFAQLYDWEHNAFRDDLDLYVALARRTGGPVIELCCGSGRVLEPIAAMGTHVVGIDHSAAMIERARARLHFARNAELVVQDMHADLPAADYGLALIALSGFGFSASPERQRQLLRGIVARLQPHALLVLDLVHAQPLFDQPQGVAVLQLSGSNEEIDAHVTKWMVQQVHPATETVELLSFYDLIWSDGTTSRLHDCTQFRYFSRFEVQMLLEASGMEIEGCYGSYDLGEFSDSSPRMIFVARPGRAKSGARRGRVRPGPTRPGAGILP